MAHEGPFRSMAPRLFGRIADTALRSAAHASGRHTTAPTHGYNPHRLPRAGAVLDDKGSREYYHSPVAGGRTGAWAKYSLDNSFLRS